MFKQELPLLFPSNIELKKISEAIMDPFEYLLKLHDDKELNLDFKSDLGDLIVEFLKPIQNKYHKIYQDKKYL